MDKLVSTMAAVTLSMSSSSEDFLKNSEEEAGKCQQVYIDMVFSVTDQTHKRAKPSDHSK